MDECKNCGHNCHCSNGGSCCGGQCECKNCECKEEEKTVEFDPDFNLMVH